jgi:hypothetical protein
MRVFPALLLFCLLLVAVVPASAISPGVVKPIGPVQAVTSRPTLFYPPTITTVTTTESVGWEESVATLIIESDPPGAEITIFLGGNQVFYTQTLVTPLSKPVLATGTTYPYTVYLKMPGYKVYTEQVALQPQQTYTIHAVLVPLTTAPTQPDNTQPAGTMTASQPGTIPQPSLTATALPAPSAGWQASPVPGTGSLSVTTNPPGANIFIDGIPGGATPATVPGLPAGMHNLTITMTGYAELVTQINIVGGQTMEYSTTLIPATIPTKPKSPGFEASVAGLAVAGIVFMKRKI